jgi:hypothetical protein
MSEPSVFDWVSIGANLAAVLVALGAFVWTVRQFSKEQAAARDFFERERAADRELLAEQVKATTMAKQQDEAARMLSAALEALKSIDQDSAIEALERFNQHGWVVQEYWPWKSDEREELFILIMMVGEHVIASSRRVDLALATSGDVDLARTDQLTGVVRRVLGPFVRGFTEVERKAVAARLYMARFATGDRLTGLELDGSGYEKIRPVVDRIIAAWLTPQDFVTSEIGEPLPDTKDEKSAPPE